MSIEIGSTWASSVGGMTRHVVDLVERDGVAFVVYIARRRGGRGFGVTQWTTLPKWNAWSGNAARVDEGAVPRCTCARCRTASDGPSDEEVIRRLRRTSTTPWARRVLRIAERSTSLDAIAERAVAMLEELDLEPSATELRRELERVRARGEGGA